MIRTLSLFSGIGAFDLGLERTGGFKTVAFCECEPFCRAVLAHHWPEVPCYDDVRTLTAARLAADGLAGIDAICGGFPCQDLSVAGRGAGLDAARSGLWHEYARLIGEILPRWVIIENVPALRSRGLDRVLGSLAAFGYDAEWHCIPAAALGAHHTRDRIFIVSHPNGGGRGKQGHEPGADADARARQPILNGEDGMVAGRTISEAWPVEPDVGRVVDGAAGSVDRRKRLIALGNALVPQIPEMIGNAILRCEAAP